jgi:diaminopimelate decarboxylase
MTGLSPQQWGLRREAGALCWGPHALPDLAARWGTPLHVASAERLRTRARQFQDAFAGYAGGCALHFSYKTNPVAGILRVLHGAGLGAEVVCGYELWLALRLGVPSQDIVFNGPNKRDDEITAALDAGVGLLVVDNLGELDRVERAAAARGVRAHIGLRVCPDVVPRRMNTSSLTGSRRNQFGLDLPAGEATAAIARVARSRHLALRGVMAHIGSGIHDLRSFARTIDTLLDIQLEAVRAGCEPELLDVGGGLGVQHSREFTTLEMLAYLGFGRLPRLEPTKSAGLIRNYADAVCTAVEGGCRSRGLPLPRIVLEPGRAMVSDSQVMLLRVGVVRERPGVGRFAMTDGGAMTVSMMFLSELHAVFLANREGSGSRRVSIFGALPSPMDVVYRNIEMPPLEPGDLLAVMDAGAYFSSTATNFGGPRPGVVLLDGDDAQLVRRPETFEDLAALDS